MARTDEHLNNPAGARLPDEAYLHGFNCPGCDYSGTDGAQEDTSITEQENHAADHRARGEKDFQPDTCSACKQHADLADRY